MTSRCRQTQEPPDPAGGVGEGKGREVGRRKGEGCEGQGRGRVGETEEGRETKELGKWRG